MRVPPVNKYEWHCFSKFQPVHFVIEARWTESAGFAQEVKDVVAGIRFLAQKRSHNCFWRKNKAAICCYYDYDTTHGLKITLKTALTSVKKLLTWRRNYYTPLSQPTFLLTTICAFRRFAYKRILDYFTSDHLRRAPLLPNPVFPTQG